LKGGGLRFNSARSRFLRFWNNLFIIQKLKREVRV